MTKFYVSQTENEIEQRQAEFAKNESKTMLLDKKTAYASYVRSSHLPPVSSTKQ